MNPGILMYTYRLSYRVLERVIHEFTNNNGLTILERI